MVREREMGHMLRNPSFNDYKWQWKYIISKFMCVAAVKSQSSRLHLSVVTFFLVLREQCLQYFKCWELNTAQAGARGRERCCTFHWLKPSLQFSPFLIGLVALEVSTFTRSFIPWHWLHYLYLFDNLNNIIIKFTCDRTCQYSITRCRLWHVLRFIKGTSCQVLQEIECL